MCCTSALGVTPLGLAVVLAGATVGLRRGLRAAGHRVPCAGRAAP
jgi:hypothetical protein